ncbi:MAG: hypothetical protein IT578_10045 [Verrucomicrobiae bacterium]|nr:hypothetical protein [Verrucomicrobiae bacterium]
MKTHCLLPVMLFLSLSTLFSSAQTNSANADNPALTRFGDAITFYLSFDRGVNAELAKGEAAPTKTDDGEPQFLPGLHGKAMMLVGKGQSTFGYSAAGNVDLTRPGAAVAWTSPHDWVRSDTEDYFFPVTIMSHGVKLLLGRQGRLKADRTDMIYAWAKLGDSKEILIQGGNSLGWQNGEWHLWVMNWRSNAVEFSLDGAPLGRVDTPVRFPSEGDGAGLIKVGAQSASCRYLIDEVMILDRPLTDEEATWIYDEGMKQ